MTTMYSTTVREIGPEAATFAAEGMAVLFGPEAPGELRDFCYIIERTDLTGTLAPGATLHLGDAAFAVTAVGAAAQKNLVDLGHVTLHFSGATQAELAGTIYLEAAGGIPPLSVGTTIALTA